MSNFTIIQDVKEINLGSEWVDVPNKSPFVFVAGRKYDLVAVKERAFTLLERILKITLALLTIVITAGIALCFRCVQKLFDTREIMRFGILYQEKPKEVGS